MACRFDTIRQIAFALPPILSKFDTHTKVARLEQGVREHLQEL
jgi:hypothetical protein